jgi:hypothetical protein
MTIALLAPGARLWAQPFEARRALVHAPEAELARLAGAPIDIARDALTALDAAMGATPVPRFAAYRELGARRVLVVAARFSEHELCVREANPTDDAAFATATRACRRAGGSFDATAIFVSDRPGTPLSLVGALPARSAGEAAATEDDAQPDEEPAYMEETNVTGVAVIEDGGELRVVERRTETWIEQRPMDYDEEEARGMSADELEGRVRRRVISVYDLTRTLERSCAGGPETDLASCGRPEPRVPRPRRTRPRRR